MKNPIFSINAAAAILERDRGTITRALRGVPPDAHENKSPRWRLRTVVDALAARERSTARGNAYPNPNPDIMRVVDKIEDTFAEFDAGIARLRAESDLERRRAIGAEIGPLIGRLERLTATVNQANTESGTMMQIVADKIIGGAIFTLFDLCRFQIAERDNSRERA